MKTPTLTLDTTVVIDAIERSRPAAIALFAPARMGTVDVAFSTRLSRELVRHSTDEVRALLGGGEPQILGTVARWDISTGDGGDRWASGGEVTVPTGHMDSDHLEAHRHAGRDFFVTNDIRLRRAAARYGIDVLTPEEVVKRFATPDE